MPNRLAEDDDDQIREDSPALPESLELPVLPTRDLVLFPFMQAPLLVGRELSMQAVTRAGATADKLLLVCLQRRADD